MPSETLEILRAKDLTTKLGISRSTLWKGSRTGFFRSPIRLGGPTSRLIGWRRTDVEQWIRSARPHEQNRPRRNTLELRDGFAIWILRITEVNNQYLQE